jgi:glycosyltransferase involved in cell wall biosynthesis
VPAGVRLLVVDAESEDGTAEVAQHAGARVVVRPWDGFVAARRAALGFVDTPWTLMLDADERLDDALRAAILAAVPGERTAAYALRRTTYFCGRPMRGAGWGNERLVRLFRTHDAILAPHPAAGGAADIHESWSVAGDVGELGGTLQHDSYPTIASYREKFARYTAIEAHAVRGGALPLAAAAGRALLRAPWLFLARDGWRDGWRGAYVCAASALYPVAVAWKALRGA